MEKPPTTYRSWPRILSAVFMSVCLITSLSSCFINESIKAPIGTAFTSATVWSAHLDTPIEDGVLLVREGKVIDLFSAKDRSIPNDYKIVDLAGSWVIPGIVNGHGHIRPVPGFDRNDSPPPNEAIAAQLKLYASYGVTTVKSHGNEPVEAWEWRDKSQTSDHQLTRVYMAGTRISSASMEEAMAQTEKVLERNPDFIKVAIDSKLGRIDKMSQEVAAVVIEKANQNNTRVTAHMIDYEDAEMLMESGVGHFAHSVRSRPIDEHLINLMLEKNVCSTPTLMREIAVFVWGEEGDPQYLDDPLFMRAAHPEFVEMINSAETKKRFKNIFAQWARSVLPIAIDNMMAIHRGGGIIAMGSDSGPGIRPQGYFDRLEMELMEKSGMTAEEVLIASTYNPAKCFRTDDEIGTLQSGRWADFLVIEENPLDSVRALRSMKSVYIGGKKVSLENTLSSL